MDSPAPRFNARSLLRWFSQKQRSLPWRRDRDPYRIWVSEVMLQQTQVSTVIPFFERFLTAFPDLASLSAADEQAVLKLWEGLGYYRRARHLHAAAKQLHENYPEAIPADPEVWAELPGVGRYILGAVLSQAFEKRLPILEANTKRLLARYFAHSGEIDSKPTQNWLWTKAEEILPRKRIGDFNQALMELGALICTPKKPNCPECPLQHDCAAKQQGRQENLPVAGKKPTVTEVREVALVIRRGSQLLLCQRPDQGRWSRMWEFPHFELLPEESPATGAKRLLKEMLHLQARIGTERTTIEHRVTRFQIRMHCLEASYRRGDFASPFYLEALWVEPEEIEDYPLSVPQRKLLGLLFSGGSDSI
jgi:A/G-specific adenine glycosylase